MPDQAPSRPKTTWPRPGRRSTAARDQPGRVADFPVVGIGASAGGLEACKALLDALPARTGMAFVLVQHLDPTHKSLMVELLAEHTAMPVLQAAEGMLVEPDHLYVIPPGSYLSAAGGALHLSPSQVRDGAPRGARLPFDVLLHSMSVEYGRRAVCVVLSGTGADGSLGLAAVKAAGGLAIVQDPEEAGYDGMPRSAIGTGVVDAVAKAAAIPSALAAALACHGRAPTAEAPADADPLSGIIALLRARTKHDFAPYKRGTLERRVERRTAIASFGGQIGCKGGTSRERIDLYLDLLRTDAGELDLLAKDLLIHVTSFFRDPAIYAALADTVIPGLVQDQPQGQPLRIWIAGCSTGEEAYSLVILFREAITAAGRDIKLQAFASDIDAEAVASAREGLYPASIEADVSATRLARFFCREEDGQGYRVLPDVRAALVFTVQDLLADPPFSRLDLVSCRNLLIYLGSEAQAKAVAVFHFALREGGTLLLGSAETVGAADSRFELIQKSARLYRHVGPKRPGDLNFAGATVPGKREARSGQAGAPSRQAELAELCRQLVLDQHAPAAVLCNARHECLYSLGPTDRYLRVPPGHATPDLLAMARGTTMRTRLRSALARASKGNARVVVPSGRMMQDGRTVPFSIDIQPVRSGDEAFLLVCFVDEPALTQGLGRDAATRDAPRIAELERELEAVQRDLEEATRTLEASGREQRAINEETLSVNEEYQSTNEELLTSKEELQSLNEELTALNSQLQETLERQRTTSNDLQNILYSTDVATLFLDRDLGIRFFTPATRALFNVIPGDIGRPLADLHSLSTDTLLLTDARTVLDSLQPVEREIGTPYGTWFRRRVLPYRTEGDGVEGVVITFNDITQRRQTAAALETAKQQAEAANRAKSRFLAAASHDLRQPLQTLALLQGLLARSVTGENAAGLVTRLDETLGAMSGMLDTLLDLNQIEAGVVQAAPAECRIDGLLGRLRDQFAYHAEAKGLGLRVMPCSAMVRTDQRLLEQMLRNLLSNALKYTGHGRVLLGCRRHKDTIRIEVWDTGPGIPDGELQAVFEEYHQLGNEARERSRGLGLGLSIVQRLGVLLGHRVSVRSQPGRGSVFTIEVARATDELPPGPERTGSTPAAVVGRGGSILVIEDDPALRDLLRMLLEGDGHHVTAAPDGPAALALAAAGGLRPDLLLADLNLPGGMDGLHAAVGLRTALARPLPVIILSGDTSACALQAIALQDCVHLSKPVKAAALAQAIQRLLAARPERPLATAPALAADGLASKPVVFVVDDDGGIRTVIRAVLEEHGLAVEDFADGEAFLAAYRPGREGCLLVDASMPGIDGFEVLRRLGEAGHRLPAIVITGHGDVSMAVRAMKGGALDFIEKPVRAPDLLAGIARALDQSRDAGKRSAWHVAAADSIAALTPRQRDIMALVLSGHPSKNIAADLGISQRTVENHRASIMRRTGSRSLPALARLALAAASDGAEPGPPSDQPVSAARSRLCP